MSKIRKRSLKATFWVYLGFGIGAINTYFLTHQHWFTTAENGLVRAILEIGLLVFAFSSLGTTSFLYKFFPYYQDNLDKRENDILALSLIVSIIGFLLTSSGLYLMYDVIVRKFSGNSLLLVKYFFWVLPVGFFALLFNLLEAYSYGFQKGVITTFLKEALIRCYTFMIIVLKILDIISFKTFITLLSLQFAFIFLVLLVILSREGKLWICFRPSRVTLKFRKKIIAIMGLTSVVLVVTFLRQSIDGLVLAAKLDLSKVAIFGLAVYITTLLQAPFRSIVAVTIPILSRKWKDKDLSEINRIYKRSSINLLTFTLFLFFLILLNFTGGIKLLHINPDYLEGKWVFIILGIVAIIETGTGISGQIIATSTHWRFELWTSILLTSLIIPFSYFLTVKYGIIGPAIANLISFSIYNSIRYFFLLKKFNLQPFTKKTAEVLLIAGTAFLPAFVASSQLSGWTAILVSSSIYSTVFLSLAWWRDISPDLKPVVYALKNRIFGKTTAQ